MTKEVLVTIKGIQLGAEEEPIITTAGGTYHFTNDWHYIRYEEKSAESNSVLNNTIKLSTSKIILTKKTNNTVRMEFNLDEITQAAYKTPYGEFIFDIRTESILLTEEPEKIEAAMRYSLTSGGSHVSDNSIVITVIPACSTNQDEPEPVHLS